MVFAASACHLNDTKGDSSAKHIFVPGDLDLDIQTCPFSGS